MADQTCPCIIPDEYDNCIDCGQHIDIPDAGPCPNLGDIRGIIQLLHRTTNDFASVIAGNTDPHNSALPRLRLIGGQFVRIPHQTLLLNLAAISYKEAKGLGYRGTFDRWADLVREDTSARL